MLKDILLIILRIDLIESRTKFAVTSIVADSS